MADRDEEIIASLRRWYDAFNRGDFDAAAAMVHPHVEYVRPGGQSSIKGADQIRAWMEPDAFESQVLEPLEFTVAGNKVLVRQQARVRGAGSGIEMEMNVWTVCTIDDEGRATRLEVYLPHEEAEARRAAGLADD
jgi:ketosteroid isomerase-like protein